MFDTEPLIENPIRIFEATATVIRDAGAPRLERFIKLTLRKIVTIAVTELGTARTLEILCDLLMVAEDIDG